MPSVRLTEKEWLILGAGALLGMGFAVIVGYYYQKQLDTMNAATAKAADTYAAALGYTPVNAAGKSVTPTEEARE